MNAQSGVCTPAGGLVTGEQPPPPKPRTRAGRGWWSHDALRPHPAGVLVLLSLDYLTSLFYYIPKSALAAVIIMAVAPLFDAGIFGTLWRVKSTCVLAGHAHVSWILPPPSSGTHGARLQPGVTVVPGVALLAVGQEGEGCPRPAPCSAE